MNKKAYMKPQQRIIELQHRTHLLQASMRSVSTNLDDEDEFIFGGGGSGPGR